MIKIVFVIAVSLLAFSGKAGEIGNLVKNPDFEEGKSVGWKTDVRGSSSAGMTDSVPAPSGKYCGFLIKQKGDLVAALTQDITVKPGEKYLLACNARGKGVLFGYIYDKDKKYAGQISGIWVNTPEWSRYEKTIVIPAKARTIQLRFELFGNAMEGRGWIDQIFFAPPPPAPAKISNLKAVLNRKGEVELSWGPVQDSGVIYQIFRSRYPDMNACKMMSLQKTRATAWIDTELPRNWNRCYYQVNAVVQGANGDLGDRIMVELPASGECSEPVVWTASPMEKIRRYQDLPPRSSEKQEVKLGMAKNETESVQILVGAGNREIRNLNVAFTGFKKDGKVENALQSELFEVRYVMVNQPTNLPERYTPGLYPDPLLPWKKPVHVPVDAVQGIWLQVKSSPACPTGHYSGTVSLTVDEKTLTQIKIELDVWDFALPQPPSFMSAFAIWRNFISQAHGVRPGSQEEQELYEKYYWFMVDRRMPPDDLPVPVTSPEAERYLNDPRVNSFRIPCQWSKVNMKEMKKNIEHLRKKGWLSKGYVYCEDEPTPERYSHCRSLADQIHQAGRDIAFLLPMTTPPDPILFGGVDIWVQKLDSFDNSVCRKRKEAGDRLWWYTCVSPQSPYPTYLIDDSGVSPRVLSWLQAKYRVEGVLYWCVNLCSEYKNGEYQPEISVWEKAEMFPYGNGDGFLVYPGKQVGINGPVSSIRLELIRDGNEDVEYFNLLRRLMAENGIGNIEEKIAQLIHPVADDLIHWTKDPRKLMKQREILASQILKQMEILKNR